MTNPCNLLEEWRVPPLIREGGCHVCTPFKSMGSWNLVNVSGGLPSDLAIQLLVGLFLQRAGGGRHGCFLSFKNNKIHLNLWFAQEER